MHFDIYKKEYDFSLNIFSWVILIAFLCASLVMQVYPNGFSFEGPFFSLPVICLMVYWSEKEARFLKVNDSELTSRNKFHRNFFITAFSMNMGSLISLLFQYNNSDVRGIWPIAIYYTFFSTTIFSILYSMISYILPTHKQYTFVFSFIIFTIFAISKFWPYYVLVPYVGQTNFYTVVMASLILMHLLFSFVLNIKKLISKS
jgi:hypothetical protein